MYTQIDIDFDVYKALTMRRDNPEMAENDVLRELLDLKPKSSSEDENRSPEGVPWVWKNVRFPHGTKFKATYKGRTYRATVEDGALVYDGERYKSPSAAATAVTDNQENGWRFWDCKLPGEATWRTADNVRSQQKSR